jgi:PAS domain S-box-containing protein
MLDALPVAIYVTDAKGALQYFNPAAVEFSGRVPELASDHWCVTWKLCHLDGTPMLYEQYPMEITRKEGRPVRGVPAIAELPDGTRRCFEPFSTPLFDEDGTLIGGINMLLDITSRIETDEARHDVDRRKDDSSWERARVLNPGQPRLPLSASVSSSLGPAHLVPRRSMAFCSGGPDRGSRAGLTDHPGTVLSLGHAASMHEREAGLDRQPAITLRTSILVSSSVWAHRRTEFGLGVPGRADRGAGAGLVTQSLPRSRAIDAITATNSLGSSGFATCAWNPAERSLTCPRATPAPPRGRCARRRSRGRRRC